MLQLSATDAPHRSASLHVWANQLLALVAGHPSTAAALPARELLVPYVSHAEAFNFTVSICVQVPPAYFHMPHLALV